MDEGKAPSLGAKLQVKSRPKSTGVKGAEPPKKSIFLGDAAAVVVLAAAVENNVPFPVALNKHLPQLIDIHIKADAWRG